MDGKIFLITGKPGSGKTFLWEKIWGANREKIAGYRTVPYEEEGSFAGYVMENLSDGEKRPISRKRNGRFEGITETFQGFGAELLKKAVESDRDIIILDELGRFEKDCEVFIDAVWQVVHSKKMVCLILKKEPISFIEGLKKKSGGFLIDMDELGREKAHAVLVSALRQCSLTCSVQVKLYLKEKSFGPGPMCLLKTIEKTGSLSRSAKEMGMSYSKAWTVLQNIEKEWGFPLLQKQVGGNHGGGSSLTAEGKELLMRYEAFCRDMDEAAGESLKKHFDRPIFS